MSAIKRRPESHIAPKEGEGLLVLEESSQEGQNACLTLLNDTVR